MDYPSRASLANATGHLASFLSKVGGFGAGETIGGAVALKVDPDLLSKVSMGRSIALVSATNGKTTTNRFLACALASKYPSVASNSGGANMASGIAHALSLAKGVDVAALEVDESWLPMMIENLKPKCVLMLNLTRDQLDRSNEVRKIAKKWKDAVSLNPEVTYIVNADDPLVSWSAIDAKRAIYVAGGQNWTLDSKSCPNCGELIENSADGWACSGCNLKRMKPDFELSGVDGSILVSREGEKWHIETKLPGSFNRSNAAFGAVAASVMGVPLAEALRAIKNVKSVGGRYETVEFNHNNFPLRLLLAKNPAGWLEALSVVNKNNVVVLAINAREVDGRDPSWLWDVDFGVLKGAFAVVTGERARDLGVRLSYLEIDHVTIHKATDALRIAQAQAAKLNLDKNRPIDVIANYTAFQGLRKIVKKMR